VDGLRGKAPEILNLKRSRNNNTRAGVGVAVAVGGLGYGHQRPLGGGAANSL
jgi:hypothetical protein